MDGDQRGRIIEPYAIRRLVIALDAAFVDKEYQAQGDFVYADADSTGEGVLSLNSPNEDKFPIRALAGVERVPYKNFYLTSDAQAGKILNLWYGTGARFKAEPAAAGASGGGLTDAELRAAPVDVVTGLLQGLTAAELFALLPLPVFGPLTDAQLRAAAVPVSGPLTDAQLRALAVPVSGPLTDAQLRALAVLTDPRPATNTIVVTGGANAIATATLPAVAGQFHYITHIFIKRVATAALAGGALLTVTSTNLGGRAWRTGNQASITVATQEGAVLINEEFIHPIKSAVVNTNTTIVGPAAGAAVSWHMVIDYFTAP